jgi:hypothetical protein
VSWDQLLVLSVQTGCSCFYTVWGWHNQDKAFLLMLVRA